jgi:hypothetical protein
VLDGGPGASSCAFARSLIPHCGDWTVDAIGQLLVRELILVSHGLLQPEQLSLPRRPQLKLGWRIVDASPDEQAVLETHGFWSGRT